VSDDTPSNPNQPFDNYAKEFQLRIEALKAVGEYISKVAEADLTEAKAADQREKTKTTTEINASLRRSLVRIERAEREAEQARSGAERRIAQLNYLVGGKKPFDLTSFNARLEALEWIFDKSGDGMILFSQLPADCRGAENFICISELHKEVHSVPAEVENLLQLVDWLRTNLHFVKPGVAAHRFLVDALGKLAAAQAKVVAEIEAHLEDLRKGQYEKMAQLKTFLKID
jgi:hypothetical protein